ncbi:MAG: hypothetical protein HND58_07735 [Planctomycetota bacterium]|nr:MAG: hypothetical protein HND58_07735 [Planctomycetota bacterium]
MRFRVSASATTVAVITLQCVAQTATFENIGELPGGIDFTVGHGISRDGSTIAALSSSYFAYYGEAAYRRGDSDLIAIGALPTHQESNAAGVSATGTWIVGESVRQNEYTEAFRWSEDTGMIGLGDLPGGDRSSIARAVSRDGRVVVGGASTELDGKSVGAPFRWTPEGDATPDRQRRQRECLGRDPRWLGDRWRRGGPPRCQQAVPLDGGRRPGHL